MFSYNEKVLQELNPWFNHTNQRNIRTKVVNTDEYGFRYSYDYLKNQDSPKTFIPNFEKLRNNSEDKIIFLGGSVCFGWNSSCDSKTISSLTSKKLNCKSLNLGILAGTSTMESIVGMNFFGLNCLGLSITGINTLTNYALSSLSEKNKNKIYEIEPLMPFNEDLWNEIASLNVLEVRYAINQKLNYRKFCKNKYQLKKMNRFKRSLIWKSISTLLPNKKSNNNSYELKTIREWRSIVKPNQIIDDAIQCQKRAAIILNKIFEGKYYVIVQPHISFCDDYIDSIKKISNDKMTATRFVVTDFYDTYYESYRLKLEKELNDYEIKTINLPCMKLSDFSDSVHLTDQGNLVLASKIAESLGHSISLNL